MLNLIFCSALIKAVFVQNTMASFYHFELTFTTQLSIRRGLPWFDLSDYFYIHFCKSESSFLLICCFNYQKEAKALQFRAYTLE